MKESTLILMAMVAMILMVGCQSSSAVWLCHRDSDCKDGMICSPDGECIWASIDGDMVIEDGDTDMVSELDGDRDVDMEESPEFEYDDESDSVEVMDTDEEQSAPQCDVTGTGKLLSIQPVSESIDFGLVDIGESQTKYITICNSGTDSFTVTAISLQSGAGSEFHVQHDHTPFILDSGEGAVVGVAYQPLDNGIDLDVLEILSESDRTKVDVQLSGEAKALGRLETTPQELLFDGQSGTKQLLLKNTGSGYLSIYSLQLSDEAHFAITAIEPEAEDGLWLLSQNESMSVSITFDGEMTAQNAELEIVWSDGHVQTESSVTLSPRANTVCAIPNAGSDQIVLPTATVQLDGSLSSDPNDSPEPGELWYQWNFAQKPQGAFRAIIINTAGQAIQGVWTSEARPTFYAELPGLYVVQLRINRQDDPGCDAIDTVNIIAATEEAVHVELSWSIPGNDHDLHVIRHNVDGETDTPGCFTHSDPSNVNDCHWTNCNTKNKTAFPCPPRGCPGPEGAPDWGVVGSRDDDPALDVDDVEGTGPEELNLYQPTPGDYFVAVERYRGTDAPELAVKVWVYGVLQSTFSNVVIPEVHQHWNVCWIRVHSVADIEVVPIGVIKDSGDNTTRDCDPTNLQGTDGDIDSDVEDAIDENEIDGEAESELEPDGEADPENDGDDDTDIDGDMDTEPEHDTPDENDVDNDIEVITDVEPDEEDDISDMDLLDADSDEAPDQPEDDSDLAEDDITEIEEVIPDCTPGTVCCDQDGFYHDYGTECDDGNPCTSGDFCDGSGSCLSHPADCPGGCEFDMCMHNHAIQLTGLDTRNLYVAGSESLQIHTPNMTLEMWVKGVPGSGVIEKGKFSQHNCNYAMGFYCDVNVCSVGFGLDSDGVKYWWKAALIPGTNTDGWNHIAAVVDDLNEDVRLYHNGVLLTGWLAQPSTWPEAIVLSEYRQLQIGSSGEPVRVDEVRLSDIPRYGVSFTPPIRHEPDGNTRLLLHLNEGVGTVVHDSSEYGNHASFDLEPTPPTWVEDGPGIVFSCANNVCSDPVTGLEWQQIATGGPMTWDDAVSHCESLELDGTGWRLPTISELRTLVRDCESLSTWGECQVSSICDSCGVTEQCLTHSCWSDEYCDPDSCPDEGCYWPAEFYCSRCGRYVSSSLIEDNPGYAWTILFDYGRLSSINVTYPDSRAICVRSSL